MAGKYDEAFRTIGEVAESLDLPPHVLRFWETRFDELEPLKRAGGRRYYRARDVELLKALRHLLYGQGYTIKGVQRILREQGAKAVIESARSGRAPSLEIDETPPPAEAQRPPATPRTEPEPPPITAPAAGLPALVAMQPLLAEGLRDEDARVLRLALAELAECRRLLRMGQS
ncbi:MAG TPA: MerR family transcriptional regulator [Methylocystis sp.]|nr:MerR family transcriptional regulator [Methylocystis sp.]HXZ18145.1 MerR family transcriptional regulator [Roseiarcus sp.]